MKSKKGDGLMRTTLSKYRKRFIGAVIILAIILIWFQYQSKAWERDITVKYIGYEDVRGVDGVDRTIYKYEITNNTNRELRNVRMVVKCLSYGGQTKNYEGGFIAWLPPGDTRELRLNRFEMDKYMEEHNIHTFYDYKIKRIIYDR